LGVGNKISPLSVPAFDCVEKKYLNVRPLDAIDIHMVVLRKSLELCCIYTIIIYITAINIPIHLFLFTKGIQLKETIVTGIEKIAL
jgi:hypothetical protein